MRSFSCSVGGTDAVSSVFSAGLATPAAETLSHFDSLPFKRGANETCVCFPAVPASADNELRDLLHDAHARSSDRAHLRPHASRGARRGARKVPRSVVDQPESAIGTLRRLCP